MSFPQIKSPPLRVAEWAEYPMDRRLAERCVGYSAYRDDPEPIQLWADLGKGRMGLPRGWCPEPDGAADKTREGGRVKLASMFKPRDDQQTKVIREAWEFLKDGKSGIIEASTGVGKTAMMCHLISKVGRKTMVVVHKEDLLDSWRKDIGTFLGLKPKQIGLVKGKTINTNAPIVLASVKTLALAADDGRLPVEAMRDFGMVVWDEVHTVNATTFRKSLTLLPAKIRVGLSATPKRPDGLEFIARAHIGPVRVQAKLVPMKPKVTFVRTGWVPPIDRETGDYLVFGPKDGWVYKRLGLNVARNKLITKYIKSGYDADRKMIVFSNSLAHLDAMQALAHAAGIPPGDTSQYVGSLTKTQRDKATKARVIFATYKMGDTGTNVPSIDAVLLASPRANVEQTVGRGLRILPGKKQPVVIDFVDSKCSMFKNWAAKRLRFYTRIGSTIVRLPDGSKPQSTKRRAA